MKGIPTIIRHKRLKRAALMVGVVGVAAGASVLGAGAAHATVGTQPGTIAFNPTSGATSLTPTWSTTVGCPSGFQGSAVLREVASDGTSTATVSQAINGTSAPFSGTLFGTIAALQANDSFPNGGTQEFVVICFSGVSTTGTQQPYMDTWLTYSEDDSTYQETNTPPPPVGGTTTSLTASPNPATVGDTVTLTAKVTANSGTAVPTGTVQFESGGSAIGSPVTLDSTGTATTTTPFSAAGTVSLSAVYTPADTTFQGSTGTATETVNPPAGPNSGSEPLSVTVPTSGAFTLTVPTGTVTLAVSGSSATGSLNTITVSDTRNNFPGWSLTGQSGNFTGTSASRTISGNQLGWAPSDTALGTGVTLGPTVTPANPGLGSTAATLASAPAGSGSGTSSLGAGLTLAIPTSQAADTYSSSLTLTAVTSAA